MSNSKITKLLLKILFNKYFLSSMIFLIIIVFFDDFNLIKRFKVKQENNKLETELKYYQDEIDKNKALIEKIKTDTVFLEKFAREKYHLKRKNEEIFIIEN